jgi:hypothetical protein
MQARDCGEGRLGVGARTAIVAYGEDDVQHVLRAAPVLDRPATAKLVRKVFPDNRIDDAGDALLIDALNPPKDIAYIGCFPDLDLVCSWLLVGDRPSELAKRCLWAASGPNVYLHNLDGVDWLAFAHWSDGELVRSLCLAPKDGITENVGDPLPFEAPFWASDHRVTPLELGEEALHAFFGFRLDGMRSVDDVDPEVIPLVGYRIS